MIQIINKTRLLIIKYVIEKINKRTLISKVKKRKKNKIFIIGFNKTGTTSVKAALDEFDIVVGNQRAAELLINDIVEKKYESLYNYCSTGEAFQDIPFSFPEIYKVLDNKYPNSKFILTERDSAEQWFCSLKKFHTKIWSSNGHKLLKEDLINADYVFSGFAIKCNDYVYGKEEFYNKEHYESVYLKHNTSVKEYFISRPEDLLVINVAEQNSYIKLCEFINEIPKRKEFEWKNKT